MEKVWSRIKSDAEQLALRLKGAGKDTIDYFFNHNPSVSDLGRILLAAEISECEFNSFSEVTKLDENKVHGHNWLRQVAINICRDCLSAQDLEKNNINFITFNYDLTIERILYDSLISRENLFKSDVAIGHDQYIRNFLSNGRIVHVYGGLDWDQYSHPQKEINIIAQYNSALRYSQKMRLIAPNEKSNNNTEIQKAQELLANAQIIYILGFGFDKSNCRLIKLEELLGQNNVDAIYFTNFGGLRTIDKSVVRALGLNEFDYIREMKNDNRHFHSNGKKGILIERSIKGVLEALEEDFGFD